MYQDTAPGTDFRALNEASPVPSEGLISALQRVDAMTNHAYQITVAVAEHGDRILGGHPDAAEKSAPCPVRSGALGGLHDQIDRLEAALQRLDQQSRRFNAI